MGGLPGLLLSPSLAGLYVIVGRGAVAGGGGEGGGGERGGGDGGGGGSGDGGDGGGDRSLEEGELYDSSKKLHLGCFVTPEEAALHVARTPEAKASLLEAEAKAAAAKANAVKPRTSAAQAKEDTKLAIKAALVQARQEQKELLQHRRQQLEQHRQQMAAQQAQMLRAAAERQRQRTAPAPPAPPTAAAEPATGSTDELIQQVLGNGCAFRCLGLERGASQESVRKRYLALALRLHPDKIQHPQAHEAFAALEPAYSRARDAAADAAASTPCP